MHRNGVEGSPTETKYAQHGECFEITTELVEIQVLEYFIRHKIKLVSALTWCHSTGVVKSIQTMI